MISIFHHKPEFSGVSLLRGNVATTLYPDARTKFEMVRGEGDHQPIFGTDTMEVVQSHGWTERTNSVQVRDHGSPALGARFTHEDSGNTALDIGDSSKAVRVELGPISDADGVFFSGSLGKVGNLDLSKGCDLVDIFQNKNYKTTMISLSQGNAHVDYLISNGKLTAGASG